MSPQVDDRLFEQAPKEMEKPSAAHPASPQALGKTLGAAHIAPPTQGRFSYNVGFEQEPAGNNKRGEEPVSPHGQGGQGGQGAGPAGFRSMSARNNAPPNRSGAQAAPDANVAQARFANAKSISSASFQSNTSEDGNNNGGRGGGDQRMQQFTHSGAISSSDYFGERDQNDSEGFDITAGELMSKMSFQAGLKGQRGRGTPPFHNTFSR